MGVNYVSDCAAIITQVASFGARPNTALAASLGSDVVDASGFVKVKPTLEVDGHAGVFALGDIIAWREQKQAGKLLGHIPVVVANIASHLAGTPLKKEYKGSTEMILIPIGKVRFLRAPRSSLSDTLLQFYGAGYFDFLWGISVGNWVTSLIKGKTLLIPMYRGQMGY